jgi:hypothetical protein
VRAHRADTAFDLNGCTWAKFCARKYIEVMSFALAAELRNGEVWMKTTFGQADPAAHWHQQLADALAGKLTNGTNESTLSRADARLRVSNRDTF